jgi:uncharacterized membrane protein YdbT with pleckstrin-like domain
MPGEKMILHSHPHWWFFWKQVAAGIGVIALMVLAVSLNGTPSTAVWWLTLLAFVVWILNTIYQFFAWQTTRFAVTDQRVAYQSGFFKRRGVSIPLNRVTNVNFDQNLMARVLNNGVVTIESAGDTGDSVFENIPDPENVRNTIFAQVEADEVADSMRDAKNLRDAIQGLPVTGPGAGAPTASTAERLEQLTELRDKGLVTPEEFDAKRKEIVGGL